MCLGVPGQVRSLFQNELGTLMGQVDFGGIRREVCLACVPDVQVGEYVIVHVGFAISRIDEGEAWRVFDYLRELDGLAELETNSDG